MADINRVVLTGRLTRDVELRTIPSGTSVAQFGMAVNRRRKNDAGEWVEEANFFNIVVWGRQGENCANYIHKGSPVAIEGRLQSRSWETEDGQKRNVVEVVADNVQFLGTREGGGQQGGGQQDGSKEPGGFTEINSGSEADVPF
jgi:single-strand DNA-binding protein